MAGEYDELEDKVDHFLLHANANLRELKELTDVNSLQQFVYSARSSYRKDTVDDVEFLSKMLPELKGMVKELVEELEDIDDEIKNPEEDGMPQQDVVRYKRSLRDTLKTFKRMVEPLLPGRDLARLVKTEKVPLSQLPPGVSDKIASYLSGKEGSIQTQMAELRRDTRRGGRKTKKNRSRRKKTHGRRV